MLTLFAAVSQRTVGFAAIPNHVLQSGRRKQKSRRRQRTTQQASKDIPEPVNTPSRARSPVQQRAQASQPSPLHRQVMRIALKFSTWPTRAAPLMVRTQRTKPRLGLHHRVHRHYSSRKTKKINMIRMKHPSSTTEAPCSRKLLRRSPKLRLGCM